MSIVQAVFAVVLVFGGAPPCVDVKRVRLTVRLWTVN
jgi:hypothetical protein